MGCPWSSPLRDQEDFRDLIIAARKGQCYIYRHQKFMDDQTSVFLVLLYRAAKQLNKTMMWLITMFSLTSQ